MKLLTAKQTAEILQVTLPRVYSLARENKLPVVRIGRQIRFNENMLQEWMRRGGCSPSESTNDSGKSRIR